MRERRISHSCQAEIGWRRNRSAWLYRIPVELSFRLAITPVLDIGMEENWTLDMPITVPYRIYG